MDSSPRNRRSGRSQPRDQHALLPPLDLVDWLKSQGHSQEPELPRAHRRNPSAPPRNPPLTSSHNLTDSPERLPTSPRSPRRFPASAATIGPFTPPVSWSRGSTSRSTRLARCCTSGTWAAIPRGRQPSWNISCAMPIEPMPRGPVATFSAAKRRAEVHFPAQGRLAIRRRASTSPSRLPLPPHANVPSATKQTRTASLSYSLIRDLHLRVELAFDSGVMNFIHGMARRTVPFLSVKYGRS